MIIIGINGNPGSGKTTASNLIFNNDLKRVIHLDDIFNKVKELLPGNNIKTFKKDSEEAIILNRSSLLYKTFNLKIVNRQFEIAKKIYANKILKKAINQASIEGIEYFIIEGTHLEDYDVTYLIDYLIFIKAGEEERIDRLIKRDKEFANLIFKKSLNMSDNINIDNYNLIIDNNGSKESFKQKCLEITELIKSNNIQNKKIKK